MSPIASTSASRPLHLPPSPAARRKRARRAPAPGPCACLLLCLVGSVAAGSAPQPLVARDTSPARLDLLATSTSPSLRWYERAAAVAPANNTLASTTAAARTVTTVKAVAAAASSSANALTLTSVSVATKTSVLVGVGGSSTSSSAASTTSSAGKAVNTTVPAGYTIPSAFDETLGTTFVSTACPSFFSTFLADPDFIGCVPFGLLLSSSSGFFDAEKQPYSELPYILNASCAANKTTCVDVMSSLAAKIRLASTCGEDLNQGNAIAIEALEGFQNYEMMYSAGCQKNNSTGQANASDIYFYYLPTATALPSGTKSCSDCTHGLMDIYSRYANNTSLQISQTYAAAQGNVSQACGSTFAPIVAVTTAVSGSPPPRSKGASWISLVGFFAIGLGPALGSFLFLQ
ncbi:hypothetical protein MNV49_004011 [Pseudohyphozyma bogoriensis]|nr:hypothetical protein MNV49_004011 [Pseudohyphozyma bogoriensis]